MSNASNGSRLNNRHYPSYQQGSYVPPGQVYAEQQTNVLTDAVKTQYQAESTANVVLTQLSAQRQQLKGAHDDIWEMRQATEKAKREIRDLQQKYRQKRHRLYAIIAGLAFTDFVLFLRIVHCGGSFFC
jgi:hypothetical protein